MVMMIMIMKVIMMIKVMKTISGNDENMMELMVDLRRAAYGDISIGGNCRD